jgi:hypothetical protein
MADMPLSASAVGNVALNQGVARSMAENPDDAQDKTKTFREQAARCRRLASQTTDREIAQRLMELAQEFEQLASELETGKRCI